MTKDEKIKYIQLLLPKVALSWIAGIFANSKIKWLKNFIIRAFIKKYGVNMSEALYSSPSAYASFNDFFIRQLQKEARPFTESYLVSPVDGIISEAGNIKEGLLMQAKGKTYTLQSLLGTEEFNNFFNGYFATFYLSPKDYHRIHMPLDGIAKKTIYIPGKLFSVQPATQKLIPNLFAQNERVVIYFDTPKGEMIMVLVGAVIVGKIATTWTGEFIRSKTKKILQHNPISLKQGDEVGYFKLGSTVILLLSKDTIDNKLISIQQNIPVNVFQKLV